MVLAQQGAAGVLPRARRFLAVRRARVVRGLGAGHAPRGDVDTRQLLPTLRKAGDDMSEYVYGTDGGIHKFFGKEGGDD